jgi:hypothetical protein
MGLPCYGSFRKPLRARPTASGASALEETQEGLQPPASVHPVTEIHENLGISADVATDDRECSEIAQLDGFKNSSTGRDTCRGTIGSQAYSIRGGSEAGNAQRKAGQNS